MTGGILVEYYERERTDFRHLEGPTRIRLSIENIQALLKQQQSLESSLETLHSDLDSNIATQAAADQVLISLQSARKSTASLRDHVTALWALIPPLMRPTDGLKAQKVFRTVELLEKILTKLDTRDKFRVMAVGRRWRDTVNGSIILKREMGLESQDNTFFYAALGESTIAGGPPNNSGIDIAHSYIWTDIEELIIGGRVQLSNSEKEPGGRIQRVQLFNPPVKTIGLWVICPECGLVSCDHSFGTRSSMEVHRYQSESVTMGSILRLSNGLLFERKLSGNGPLDDREPCDRKEPTTIYFETTIRMHPNDPILLERRAARQLEAKRDLEKVKEAAEHDEREEHAREELDARGLNEIEQADAAAWKGAEQYFGAKEQDPYAERMDLG